MTKHLIIAAALATVAAPAPAQTVPALSLPAEVQVDEAAGRWCATVTRSGSMAAASSFRWSLAPGTATAPADYANATGNQSVRKGTSRITFCGAAGSIVDDKLVEGQEQFSLSITATKNAVVSRGRAPVTILDNDVAPPPPPATQVCPDGSVISAADHCPVVPPPPPVWVADTIHPGGYARARTGCASPYPFDAVGPNPDGTYTPVFLSLRAGEVYGVIVEGVMADGLTRVWAVTLPDNRYAYVPVSCLEGVRQQ